MALPKANRLRDRRDFTAVYQRGKRRRGRTMTLVALPVAPSSPPRPPQIGIAIGRKVSKRAVDRNRIKRQIRAAARLWLPQMAPNWQLVIVVKPAALGCEYEDFLRELEQLLPKAEVLHGDQRDHIF